MKKSQVNIEKVLENEKALLLYFYSDQCYPCKVLRPKIVDLISKEFPEIKLLLLDVLSYPEWVASLQVFSAPTLLFFIEGKEYLREGKFISLLDFRDKLERLVSLYFKR